jgi:hypothetical protein
MNRAEKTTLADHERMYAAVNDINFHHGPWTTPPFLTIDQRLDWIGQSLPMGLCILQPALGVSLRVDIECIASPSDPPFFHHHPEQAMRNRLSTSSYVQLRTGCEVSSCSDTDNAVQVTYRDRENKEFQIQGQFLVGADGKRGYVRKNFLEPRGIRQETGV